MTGTQSTAPATELDLEQAGALAPLVSPEEAARRIERGAVVIDVRSDAGREKDGRLPGATIIDRYALDGPFTPGAAGSLVSSTDQSVVVVCGSVRGSGPVAAELIRRGFSDVVHVEGGFPCLGGMPGCRFSHRPSPDGTASRRRVALTDALIERPAGSSGVTWPDERRGSIGDLQDHRHSMSRKG